MTCNETQETIDIPAIRRPSSACSMSAWSKPFSADQNGEAER